uniref:Uncharacterized protein n=2 Tax=Cupriavidus TaxID=106589 RepID=Q46YQ5_CUPPJ
MRAPADFFAKLQWEAAKLKGMDPRDLPGYIYQAVTCASDAWHMADWVFHALPRDERAKYPRDKRYRDFVRKDSEALAICREIADSSKHCRLTHEPDPQIETRFMLAPNANTGTEDIWWFVIRKGRICDIRQVIEDAQMYWCRVLDGYGLSRETPQEDLYRPDRSIL